MSNSLAKHFGLIGKRLNYSLSQELFRQKFCAPFNNHLHYHLIESNEITELSEILNKYSLSGFNVTNPYKSEILTYCNELSKEAKDIGAVNCVRVENSRLFGHNTDIGGFSHTLDLLRNEKLKNALLIGNGGAAKAVKYTMNQRGITYQIVQRKIDPTSVPWDKLQELDYSKFQLIVNCTPIGTWPEINEVIPLDYLQINFRHTCIDLVYNPIKTVFLTLSENRGAQILNGLPMLVKQAELSWKFWKLI